MRLLKFPLILLSMAACACSSRSMPSHLDAKFPLQMRLEMAVNNSGLQPLVEDKRLGVALVDITDIDLPHYAGINSNEMMYAASLPKIAILFGLFKRIEEGSIQWSPTLQQKAEAMIRYSSNEAATDLFYAVGPEYIQNLLVNPSYRLYDAKHGGGLWIGKEYGKGAAVRRDPISALSHAASPLRVALFYYLLERGKLVAPALVPQMKAALGDPGLNHKFVRGLKQRCPSAVLYRKSGSWRTFHSDSAIVEHGGKRYIAVVLINDEKGGELLERLIVQFDEIVTGHSPPECRAGLS